MDVLIPIQIIQDVIFAYSRKSKINQYNFISRAWCCLILSVSYENWGSKIIY